MSGTTTYCLDANVLIEAWQKYYNPQFCPTYWDVLKTLGKQGRIFIPEQVHEEITRTEDELTEWLKNSQLPVRKITEPVTHCLQRMYAAHPIHRTLVDNIKGRSLADPWVIAHALNEGATVITREQKVTADTAKRIRIPNVCENMGMRWMNDFEWIQELNLRFTCVLPH